MIVIPMGDLLTIFQFPDLSRYSDDRSFYVNVPVDS